MKIVIFGGDGFLGTKLNKLFSKEGDIVFRVGHREESKYNIDATEARQVLNFLESKKPDIVINTIALTSSVECEKSPGLAKELNFITAKNIATASAQVGAKLFFISSSYIFNGENGSYSENNKASASGVYAKTKLLAEKEVLKEKKNVVLRVDLLYGYNKGRYPNGILEKILSGKNIFLGNPGQIRSPLFIDDIPRIIRRLYLLKESGVFNLAGPDKIKMIDFLLDLEKIIREDSKIILIKGKKLLVPEKKDSSLNINKIHGLRIKTTGMKEALRLIKKDL